MDPLKALQDRLAELAPLDDPATLAEMLYIALGRSGWKLVRYTDHDRLNREAFDALAQEMGGETLTVRPEVTLTDTVWFTPEDNPEPMKIVWSSGG